MPGAARSVTRVATLTTLARPPIEERFPRPSLMGIVNVTPDSFSDGGLNLDPEAAVATARRLLGEGAAIVDVGGESTRPGAEDVSVDEELRRVVPVLEQLVGQPVSIDTAKAEVARRAVALGAELVNDVTALRGDPAMAGDRGRGGRLPLPDPHAGGAAHDAGGAALRRRRRRGGGVPGGAPRLRRRRGHRGTADLPRPGHRLRQDRRAELRARPSTGRAARPRPARRRRLLAQALARPAARRPARDDRHHGGQRRRCRRRVRARRTVLRVHDVREHAEALAAARAVWA